MNEKIKKFLEELAKKPELAKELGDMPKDFTIDEKISAYAGLAKKLGYDITEDDFKKYVSEADKAAQDKTGEVADDLAKLSDEELDDVAGGGANPNCKDTFLDKENCWSNDGCEAINNYYPNYQCRNGKLRSQDKDRPGGGRENYNPGRD
jgi:hypothetical protein